MRIWIGGIRLKKVLFVATVDSHIRHFHIPYLKYFHEKGYEVHVATADDEKEMFPYCDKKHTICMERNPLQMNNFRAIFELKKLLQKENFVLVHCHTPMGGVVTRIAARLAKCRKKGTKVFYTAHGFHFYKGAPFKNWLLYYPIEKWLSKYTDVLITINHEDEAYAKKMYAKRVERIDGIGVDEKRFSIQMTEAEKDAFRAQFQTKAFCLHKEDIVLTYVAEYIPRKNQAFLINVMKDLVAINPRIKLLLVGTGVLEATYKEQITNLGLEQNVLLTGYRQDVPKIFKITDIAISTSRQEGLGLNLIEAMLSDVPTVASKIRGHVEIIQEGENGFFCTNEQDCKEKILQLINDKKLYEEMKKKVAGSVQRFILSHSLQKGMKIYESEGL